MPTIYTKRGALTSPSIYTKRVKPGVNCMAVIVTGIWDDTQVWEDNLIWCDNGSAPTAYTRRPSI